MATDKEPQSYGSQSDWTSGQTGESVNRQKSAPTAEHAEFYESRHEGETSELDEGGSISPAQLADTEGAHEKEVENDLQGRLAKRAGTYTALENKSEVEYGITNNLMVEFGLFGSYHRIQDVPDFEDRNAARQTVVKGRCPRWTDGQGGCGCGDRRSEIQVGQASWPVALAVRATNRVLP